MRLDLPGRTVVITGASGGLGAGLARALRAHGANVALLDLDAEAVRQQAERLGGDRFAGGWSIDVRDLEGLQPHVAASQGHMVAVSSLIAYAHPPLLADVDAQVPPL
jgi:NAD(P)-dependent dehydrogenase (short-subunit alcohol dehydrogenase family)